MRKHVSFIPEEELWALLGEGKRKRRIGIDVDLNTEHARLLVEKAKAEPIFVSSPVPAMKAKKNPAEMNAMREAFHRADNVVEQAIRWALAEIQKGAGSPNSASPSASRNSSSSTAPRPFFSDHQRRG